MFSSYTLPYMTLISKCSFPSTLTPTPPLAPPSPLGLLWTLWRQVHLRQPRAASPCRRGDPTSLFLCTAALHCHPQRGLHPTGALPGLMVGQCWTSLRHGPPIPSLAGGGRRARVRGSAAAGWSTVGSAGSRHRRTHWQSRVHLPQLLQLPSWCHSRRWPVADSPHGRGWVNDLRRRDGRFPGWWLSGEGLRADDNVCRLPYLSRYPYPLCCSLAAWPQTFPQQPRPSLTEPPHQAGQWRDRCCDTKSLPAITSEPFKKDLSLCVQEEARTGETEADLPHHLLLPQQPCCRGWEPWPDSAFV